MKLIILYTPQCPGNAAFIRAITEVAEPYGAEVEVIDVTAEPEKAGALMERWGFGRTRNLFIRVAVDGRLIETHPGNPRFMKELQDVLEGIR